VQGEGGFTARLRRLEVVALKDGQVLHEGRAATWPGPPQPPGPSQMHGQRARPQVRGACSLLPVVDHCPAKPRASRRLLSLSAWRGGSTYEASGTHRELSEGRPCLYTLPRTKLGPRSCLSPGES